MLFGTSFFHFGRGQDGFPNKDIQIFVNKLKLLPIICFNQMNDAILKFRRYEDASLAYTGVNRHATDIRIGLMDEISYRFYKK